MDNSKRARSWKRRIQPRVGLKIVEPVLYSTLHDPFTEFPALKFGVFQNPLASLLLFE